MASRLARVGERALSIRVRVAIFATVLVALALGLAAVVVVRQQRDALTDNVEQAVRLRAGDIRGLLESGRLPASLNQPDSEVAAVQVVDASGTVVSATANLAGLPALMEVRPSGEAAVERVQDLPIDDEPFLLFAEGVEVEGGAYTIAVWGSLEPVEESEDALVAALSLGVAPLVLFVAIGSWLLVGRSLSPVESMRREVERIGGASLDRRLPEPRYRDEVGRLARTMNAMLERLERAYEEQERFVADAAHELRSPLASLRTQLETAPEADPSGDLLAEVVRLQRLTDDLLLLARSGQEAPAQTLLDFDEIVRTEAAAAAGPVAIDTSGVAPVQLRGDAGQLQRMVRNLLDNGRRHARGRVVVTTSDDAGGVVLTVGDDGPGIAETDRERIFERFVRLDAARGRIDGGSGLGLAIVKSIAEAHGGCVEVGESSAGGASFAVRLPGG